MLLGIATVFVLIDPRILTDDVSFQLSFLAVLGLICFSDFFTRIFVRLPSVLAIRESVVLTCAATVATIPLMVVDFGQISIVALIANLLVVPAIPALMLLGSLSVVVAFMSTTVSIWIGLFAWYVLHYMLVATHFFASLPFASVSLDLGVFGSVFMVAWYTVLTSFALVTTVGSDKKTP